MNVFNASASMVVGSWSMHSLKVGSSAPADVDLSGLAGVDSLLDSEVGMLVPKIGTHASHRYAINQVW